MGELGFPLNTLAQSFWREVERLWTPPPLVVTEDKLAAILVLGIAVHGGEKDGLALSGEEEHKWFL